MKCTLRQFLRNFKLDSVEEKLHFPYNVLTDMKKLSMPLTALKYSDFKDGISGGRNQLNDDYRTFCREMHHENNEQKVLKKLSLKKRPIHGKAVFNELKVGYFSSYSLLGLLHSMYFLETVDVEKLQGSWSNFERVCSQ
ncbi:MAG: hypothetical protein GY816_11020 [Cytophagales bacterium]|nr:hypothetical protein [Cytophagales bacterium]